MGRGEDEGPDKPTDKHHHVHHHHHHRAIVIIAGSAASAAKLMACHQGIHPTHQRYATHTPIRMYMWHRKNP